METKTAFRNPKGHSPSTKRWLSALFMISFPLFSLAEDTLAKLSADSTVADTLNTAKKGTDISAIEDNPWIKYSLMVGGILFFVALALIGSMRGSKKPSPAPPVGYRKSTHRHHKVKL